LIWLVLSCVTGFGFGQLFKWSQRQGYNAPTVVSVNYAVLAVTLLVYLWANDQLYMSPDILLVGGVTGVTFIASLTVMTRALEVANVAAVLTSFRMSIVVPIGWGVWIWDEPVSLAQIAGIVLSLGALFLMTRGKGDGHLQDGTKAMATLLFVFLLQGVAHTSMRWIHYAGLSSELLNVLIVIGSTAGGLGALIVVTQRHRPRFGALRMGAGIGVYNTIALAIGLTALSLYPGTQFFPINGVSIVLMDNLVAHFFWKEPLSTPARFGAALSLVSIFLVMD